MSAAVALAVVLVVGVAGLSLAMQSQRSTGPTTTRIPTPNRRPRERRPPTPPPAPPPPPPPPADVRLESRRPELLRSGTAAMAKVLAVVDERTIGSVTRSRLTLSIEPAEGGSFEATVRTQFPTPQSRAAVKVGGSVPVRYDPDDHRVVLDQPGT